MHIPERRRPWTPLSDDELRKANRAQTRNLMATAAPQDLQDLLPILVETDRKAQAAARRAADELAECLLQLNERGAA